MELLTTVSAVHAFRRALADRPLSMVPTMGYLHDGHVALLERARALAPRPHGVVALTIFVNPTQFGPEEDLASYPRDLDRDLRVARSAGVDVVFAPTSPAEVYAEDHATWVAVADLDRHLCGATRPGHFRGVCTVVAKLWGLFHPDFAIFGEKDFQQLAIVRRMHADLFLTGEVVGVPIVREPDGLAMSSRNVRLDRGARDRALALHRALRSVADRFAAGERGVAALLEGQVSALGADAVDYLEIVDAGRLRPVARIERPAVCAVAARYGGVRLIDNVRLDP